MLNFKGFLLFWVILVEGSNIALNARLSSVNEIKAWIKASDLGNLLQVSKFLGQIMSPQAKYQSWSLLLKTLLEISLVPSKPHFPKGFVLFWVISVEGSNLALHARLSSVNEIKAWIKASDLGNLLLVSKFLRQIVSPQAKCQSWSPLLQAMLEISLVLSKPHFPKFSH